MRNNTRLFLCFLLLAGLVSAFFTPMAAQSKSGKERTAKVESRKKAADKPARQTRTEKASSTKSKTVREPKKSESKKPKPTVRSERKQTPKTEPKKSSDRQQPSRVGTNRKSKTKKRGDRVSQTRPEVTVHHDRSDRQRPTVNRERPSTSRDIERDRGSSNNDHDRTGTRHVKRDRERDREQLSIVRTTRERFRDTNWKRVSDKDWYKRNHHDWRTWHHAYWTKHQRPRKKYYKLYGWRPFFCLDLSPIVRFRTYSSPLIYDQTQIVFTKEFDMYDYRPGDPIGYSVHISFDGWVRVYDRFYDRHPELAQTFYVNRYTMRRLEIILDNGRYYEDGHCLYDQYGDADHPGYATIGYRPSPNWRMGTVSLNLAAPQQYHPRYFVDFMWEIDQILYERGYY